VDRKHFDEIPRVANQICALKIFMGSSTGDLLVDDDSSLHAAFALAAKFKLIVAVHAEDECTIKHNAAHQHASQDFSQHSRIRSAEACRIAVAKAIDLCRLYGVTLYVLHVGSGAECELIAKAKACGLPVYAETTPHHLFLDESAYQRLQGRAQVNPALRTPEDRAALWQAITSGTIDIVASDHAPHTLAEKSLPYGQAPSGMPGIETTLPLLLTAYQQGKITLPLIQKLLHDNCQKLFALPDTQNNYVLIDPHKQKTICDAEVKSRCGWSPYSGMTLTGFPVMTIVNGKLFEL
jgi:dihydroorotase